MSLVLRPQADEYAGFYAGYVERIPEGIDLWVLLGDQPGELAALLSHLDDEQASVHPAPGEWSIKEVVGHICDTERVFAYRAMRIARGDTAPLPGFDQEAYVRGTNFNARSLSDLIEEFTLQRRANLLCFRPLSEAEIDRRGTASNNSVSVRALLYILAGHVLHHIVSLKTDYKVAVR
jgi:uncharacterized damage-inducible protein DinB